MLVAMASPSRASAILVKSRNAESPVSAPCSTLLTLRFWKSKSRLRMKSAIGIRCVLTTPWVRPDSHSVSVSFEIAITSSAAIRRSAVPVTMREQVTSCGFFDKRTWLSTAPPFCARPDMSRIMLALPSIWAAMPSSAPMVSTPVPPTPPTAML